MLLRLIANLSFLDMLSIVLGFVLAMAIAISFHEYLHAVVAYKNGDPTAKAMGRMTVNPLAHVDPMGIVMLVVFGFGWAKPVPINPYNFKNGKKSSVQVALAGIFGNLCLGVFFALIYSICFAFIPAFESGTSFFMNFFNIFIYYSMSLNFVLAFFNLLPIYPMDGFRVLETITKPDNAYMNFMRRYSIFVLLIAIMLNLITYYLNYTAFFVQDKIMEFWFWILRFMGANV